MRPVLVHGPCLLQLQWQQPYDNDTNPLQITERQCQLGFMWHQLVQSL